MMQRHVVESTQLLAAAVLRQAMDDGRWTWLESRQAGWWLDVAGLNRDLFLTVARRMQQSRLGGKSWAVA